MLSGRKPWPEGVSQRDLEGTFEVNLIVLKRAGLDALCKELDGLARQE